MPRFPSWLIRKLELESGLDYTTLNGRNVSVRYCPHCRARTLVGMNDDELAFQTRVDPTPLTHEQEIACVLTGRDTFALEERGNGVAIKRRDHWVMASRSADHWLVTVVPEHQCGARFPEAEKTETTLPAGAPAPF